MLGLTKLSLTLMNNEMFLPLYKALIRPYCEYAKVDWSPFLKGHNATREYTTIVRLSYEEKLKHLGLSTLQDSVSMEEEIPQTKE